MNSGMPIPKHRFHIEPGSIQGERVFFSRGQARQIATVLRLRVGARVRVFDGTGDGDRLIELTVVSPTCVEGRVVGLVPGRLEPRTKIAAYPALLQREKFEQVLQKLVEIGVWRVAPVFTVRAQVRDGPEEARRLRWRAIMREAAEQSGRSIVPTLLDPVPFEAAVRDAARSAPAIVAYEDERATSLRACLRSLPTSSAVSFFVGPEGGLAPEEVQTARAAGAHVVSLGARILRTETASPVFAALILYERGDLDAPGPPSA